MTASMRVRINRSSNNLPTASCKHSKKLSITNVTVSHPIPATALSLLSFMGNFGKRLFEPRHFIGEFSIAAHEAEQRRKQAVGGVVYFGYFLLDKQKKVTRLSRESDLSHKAQCLSVFVKYSKKFYLGERFSLEMQYRHVIYRHLEPQAPQSISAAYQTTGKGEMRVVSQFLPPIQLQ